MRRGVGLGSLGPGPRGRQGFLHPNPFLPIPPTALPHPPCLSLSLSPRPRFLALHPLLFRKRIRIAARQPATTCASAPASSASRRRAWPAPPPESPPSRQAAGPDPAAGPNPRETAEAAPRPCSAIGCDPPTDAAGHGGRSPVTPWRCPRSAAGNSSRTGSAPEAAGRPSGSARPCRPAAVSRSAGTWQTQALAPHSEAIVISCAVPSCPVS